MSVFDGCLLGVFVMGVYDGMLMGVRDECMCVCVTSMSVTSVYVERVYRVCVTRLWCDLQYWGDG